VSLQRSPRPHSSILGALLLREGDWGREGESGGEGREGREPQGLETPMFKILKIPCKWLHHIPVS